MRCSNYYPRELPQINQNSFELGQVKKEEAFRELSSWIASTGRLPGSAAIDTTQAILTPKEETAYQKTLHIQTKHKNQINNINYSSCFICFIT